MTNNHNDKLKTPHLFTRRSFLHTTLGGAVILGLANCDQVEDGLETYTGPEISEAEFITFNEQYYGAAINATTQFPHHAIIGGTPSGKTNPAAIGYRIQHLIDLGDAGTVEEILNTLLVAQENSISFVNYRGFIPDLDFANTSTGFSKSRPEFSIAENAALSTRIAMAADAFAGTTAGEKALLFLANQKEGYNFYLSGPSLAFPTSGSALNDDISTTTINYLFSQYYAELAFVLSYFIGDSSTIQDPQDGLDTWDSLANPQGVPTAQHGDSFTALTTLTVPLARNGSGYQYFHPLLAVPAASIPDSLKSALYNVLFSYLDAARFKSLPGTYSGGPNLQGNFLTDNGLSRLTVPGNAATSRESLATIDAVAVAMRLYATDSEERLALRRWIGTYDQVPGTRGPNGLYGSVVGTSGDVSTNYYARQNAAMILFDSTAPNHLESFLTANGKTSMADMLARISINLNGLPVQRVPADLPLPPSLDQIFPTDPIETAG